MEGFFVESAHSADSCPECQREPLLCAEALAAHATVMVTSGTLSCVAEPCTPGCDGSSTSVCTSTSKGSGTCHPPITPGGTPVKTPPKPPCSQEEEFADITPLMCDRSLVSDESIAWLYRRSFPLSPAQESSCTPAAPNPCLTDPAAPAADLLPSSLTAKLVEGVEVSPEGHPLATRDSEVFTPLATPAPSPSSHIYPPVPISGEACNGAVDENMEPSSTLKTLTTAVSECVSSTSTPTLVVYHRLSRLKAVFGTSKRCNTPLGSPGLPPSPPDPDRQEFQMQVLTPPRIMTVSSAGRPVLRRATPTL